MSAAGFRRPAAGRLSTKQTFTHSRDERPFSAVADRVVIAGAWCVFEEAPYEFVHPRLCGSFNRVGLERRGGKRHLFTCVRMLENAEIDPFRPILTHVWPRVRASGCVPHLLLNQADRIE